MYIITNERVYNISMENGKWKMKNQFGKILLMVINIINLSFGKYKKYRKKKRKVEQNYFENRFGVYGAWLL